MNYNNINEILIRWKTQEDITITKIAEDIDNIIANEHIFFNNVNKYLNEIHDCMDFMVKNFNQADIRDLYNISRIISKSKYWTYNFYIHGSDFKDFNMILNINGKSLYLVLADFWKEFNRDFDDYALAISILSKYYKSNYWDGSKEERERIINAFFANIRFCGDASDWGYCYKGIRTITDKMKGLDDRLIANLIKQYSAYEIVTIKVARHQIVALIQCITKNRTLQDYLKNTILYGTLTANILLRLLSLQDKQFEHLYYDVWINYDSQIKKIEKKEYESIFIDKNKWYIKNKEIYYTIEINNIYGDEDTTNKEIYLEKTNQSSKILKILFRAEAFEWRLSDFLDKKEIQNKISRWLNNSTGQMFCFSYLYIENFRRFGAQQISFMHEYIFNPRTKVIENDKREFFNTNQFYDKYIQNISCIVGKNGTGKTSIIDFLGKYFSEIVAKYDRKNKNLEEILEELELPETMKFLVIFQYGDKKYYLSNMGVILSDETFLENYDKNRGLLSGNGEKNKVYFFSNKVDFLNIVDWIDLLWKDAPKENGRNEDGVFSEIEYTRLNDIKQIIMLKRKEAVQINLLRCYIFSYIKYYLIKKEISFDDLEWEDIRLADHLFVDEKKDNWEKIIQMRDVNNSDIKEFFFKKSTFCFYMSSGQEAKFIFLAELYWCLDGYRKFLGDYGEYLKEDREQIDIGRCIQKDEAAIIYIDEGDLYYHPEWQREFIKSVCEILQERKEKCQLQVVVATNSPYILSDFFAQDVVYILDDGMTSPDTQTFGQNIHTLLSSPFFMNSTLGCIAYDKIKGVIKLLGEKSDEKINKEQFEEQIKDLFKLESSFTNIQEYLNRFADSVGEEIYKMQIERLLREVYPEKTIDKDSPEAIEREIERLKERLEKINERK